MSSRLKEQEKSQDEEVKLLQKYYDKHKSNKKDLDNAKKRLRVTRDVMDFFGIEPEVDKKKQKDADKAQKDKEKRLRDYERSKQNEFNQLKKVKDLFEKLRDLYGDIGALDKIRKSGLVASKYIPQNVETRNDFIDKYKALLNALDKSINGKSDTLKSLKDNIKSDIFNLGFDRDKDELDKQVQILETELQRAGEAWTRYKKLVDDGISKNIAGVMSFGVYSGETDMSQRKTELAGKASNYIGRKTGKIMSDDEMNRVLNMNEAELKIHFGNNSEITNGLWKIVEAYQNVAKEIRSENDKLISDLYKDSLTYAEKLDNISAKERRDIATIREKAANHQSVKERYNTAVSKEGTLNEQIVNEYKLLNNTKEGKNYLSLKDKLNASKKALDNFNNSLNGKKPTETQKKNRAALEKDYAANKQAYAIAETAYFNSQHYKSISNLEQRREDASKEVKNSREALSDTLPPEALARLIAQIKIRTNTEKGGVLNEMFEKSADYRELFDKIYSLTAKTANKIADGLIGILDKRLEEGTITSEEYDKKRSEIEEQKQKSYDNNRNSSLLFNGLGGVTRARYDKYQGEAKFAANRMEKIQRDIQLVDKNENLSPEEKKRRKTNLRKEFKEQKKAYDEAKNKGDNEKQREATQKMAGDVIGQISNAAESMVQFRDSLGNTLSSFGVDTENNAGWQTFSTAVDVMSDIGSGMSNAFQSIMNGDFFGAAISMITTPLNIITAFNKLHDKKLDIQIEQSKKRSKDIAAAAEQISNSIKDSLGTEAAKADALSSYGLLSKQLDAVAQSRNGEKKLGNIYKEVYQVLNGDKSLLDYADTYDDSYRAKEAREALMASGLNLGSQSYLDLIDQRNAVKKEYENSMRKDMFNGTVGSNETKALKDKLDNLNGLIETEKKNSSGQEVSVYGAQYLALIEQRKELEKQMSLENDKKNADSSKMKDYRDQLVELNNQIREFAKNLAKELYGIDLSSWASKLGDALTTAFENGEDSAQAFKKSVNEILRDVAKNMVIQDIMKPALKDLETKLFGEEGKSGGLLSDINDPAAAMEKAMPIISDYLNGLYDKIPVVNALLDGINKATDGAITDVGSSSSSITKSEQSLTEETGSLLASYVNAIRADVSISRGYLQQVVEVSLPQMSVLAESQLKQLNAIVQQTKLIEENTRSNTAVADAIRKSLDSVITTSGSGKAIRFKA